MSPCDISEVVKNYLTSIAIIIGGTWTFFKWKQSENLRKIKDMTAIESLLKTEVTVNSDTSAYVTLIAEFNNKSPLPYTVDTEKSKVELYEIPSDISIGLIHLDDNPKKTITIHRPYENYNLTLQPFTLTSIPTHYKSQKGSTYLFRWELIGKKEFMAIRTLLLHIPNDRGEPGKDGAVL